MSRRDAARASPTNRTCRCRAFIDIYAGLTDNELRRYRRRHSEEDSTVAGLLQQVRDAPHGAHHCLGHLLARMEMRHLYQELFRQVERIELAGEPRLAHSVFVGGLKALPIRFTAK